MQLLLTSGGIGNTSIHNALVDLLGKPIAESRALVIPTAIDKSDRWGRRSYLRRALDAVYPLVQMASERRSRTERPSSAPLVPAWVVRYAAWWPPRRLSISLSPEFQPLRDSIRHLLSAER